MSQKPRWAVLLRCDLMLNGITQQELAQKMGCSITWVSSVMNGKRQVKNAREKFEAAAKELIAEKAS